jgi:NADPH-dependent glutamate synthase beta subunit-like oxidoreductase
MNQHLVAIFGGAVSGAEAAHQLAQRGIRTVVFDQHFLPYGKLEDGLPKWHAKLRDKEEANIDQKLDHPLVHFVPGAALGKEIDFEEIAKSWGISALLLAIGAWRDRPLPLPNASQYVGKGLWYQNPFIHWFNHCHEPGYLGEPIPIQDGALVVGGGLASIDVVKVLMILTVQKALAARGHEVDIFTLERGISQVLDQLGFTLSDLGLRGCTLVYRRRAKDMPLYFGEDESPEKLAKAELVREKILVNAQNKYLFQFLPCHAPEAFIAQQGRLTGLRLHETSIRNGRVVEVPGTDKNFYTPLVISSIGSVPEPIPGVPWQGEVFRMEDEVCCRIEGYKNVFALGNTVTGRGNIRDSLRHGREITQTVASHYLSDPDTHYHQHLREKEESISQSVKLLTQQINLLPPPSEQQMEETRQRVRALHQKVGYDGNYRNWIRQHLPVRLEDTIQK